MRVPILGVGFDNLTMEEAVERALEIVKSGGYIVTPNPEIVLLSRSDREFRAVINKADLVVPDGIGIIYGAKILGTPLKERVPGIDLCTEIMKRLANDGGSVFLFGAKPGVAEMAAEKLKNTHRGLKISGTADGYFKDIAPVVEKIKKAAPDLLIVCLGAPKQENFMYENRESFPSCLMMGLGGALDGYAGIAKRAPESWRRLGMEWLYRLIRQPTRITRMMKLPFFIILVVIERLRGTKKAVEESNNG